MSDSKSNENSFKKEVEEWVEKESDRSGIHRNLLIEQLIEKEILKQRLFDKINKS